MVRRIRPAHFVGLWIVLVVLGIGTSMLSGTAYAQPAENIKNAMALLKGKDAKLGTAEVKGEDPVAGKTVPALVFGKVKMNNNFALVDEVQKVAGGTATFFVKSGDEYVRVATNVKKDDSSRAIGTILDPKGKAIGSIRNGEAYYGEADILGKTYITG